MSHLRTYITGLGTGGALIAAVIVALIALGGIVAVEGIPNSSQSPGSDDVLVETNAVVSASALVADAATAANSDGPGANQRKSGASSGGSKGSGSDRDNVAIGGNESLPEALPPAAGLEDPPSLTSPPPSSPGSPNNPSPNPRHPNPGPPTRNPPRPPVVVPPNHAPVGGLVGQIDDTIRGVTGFSPGLPGTLSPITSPIDGILGPRGGGPAATPEIPSIVGPGFKP